MKKQAYDPAADFPSPNWSVFSTTQIYRLIDTEQRLNEAAFYAEHGWDGRKTFKSSGIHIPKAA